MLHHFPSVPVQRSAGIYGLCIRASNLWLLRVVVVKSGSRSTVNSSRQPSTIDGWFSAGLTLEYSQLGVRCCGIVFESYCL